MYYLDVLRISYYYLKFNAWIAPKDNMKLDIWMAYILMINMYLSCKQDHKFIGALGGVIREGMRFSKSFLHSWASFLYSWHTKWKVRWQGLAHFPLKLLMIHKEPVCKAHAWTCTQTHQDATRVLSIAWHYPEIITSPTPGCLKRQRISWNPSQQTNHKHEQKTWLNGLALEQHFPYHNSQHLQLASTRH
jgi:hypothetical protein